MDELRELYQQLILDHNQKPRNFRSIENCDFHKKGYNPLCGDQLEVFVNVTDNMISDISFTGTGCAISKASASIMTEILFGKSFEASNLLFKQFREMAMNGKIADGLPLKLSVLSGIYKYPARVKCALLAWHTFHQSFDSQNIGDAKTE
jgi:nitrogen fixation protein NifU and related proteins